jgi:hypothetical protein
MNTTILKLGTAHMNDDEFMAAFEHGEIAGSTFHHADHIRLAYLYLTRFPMRDAEQRVLIGIRSMAARLGVPEKFNYTQTAAWLRVISAEIALHPEQGRFDEWVVAHQRLLDMTLLGQHYTKELLNSDRARSGWAPPNLEPLP